MTKRALPIALLCLCFFAGCGGGGGGSTQSTATTPSKARLPLERAIHRSFPKPEPDPEVQGSARAIKDGEAACEGMTPKQVVHEYAEEAELTQEQRKALAQLPAAEAHPTADYVAGQLAALAYEGTLEGEAAEYGYRGCVYVLASRAGEKQK